MHRAFSRRDFYPRTRMSAAAAREEFCLPLSGISDLIATSFDIVWIAHPTGEVAPAVWHRELCFPYGCRPATQKEIALYRAAHNS